jgi:radical SAM-linked protein
MFLMDTRVNYRAVFEKTGSAKYISHLDLNRCMQRAIRRAGLPAWYTEGFHPHMYLMFALALSLGAESLCETMDFRLTQELPAQEVLERLNAALPEGLKVHDVHAPVHQSADIAGAQYRVHLAAADVPALAAQWEAFLAQPECIIEKKTKHRTREIDILPMISVQEMTQHPDFLEIILRLPAGNDSNLNISVVTDAFKNHAEQAFTVDKAIREKIFCRNEEEFF